MTKGGFAMAKTIAGYPQMPPLTEEEIEVFLSQALIARLGTLNEDNTIHIAPILFKYENGEFTIGTQNASRRVRNIKRNPQVTLLIDDPTPPFKSVLVYGKAELDYDGIVQKRIAIFERSNPPEQAAQMAEGLCNKWPGVIIRIKPDRMVSFDYSKASFP
jgi:nitroimidazol reductase NimA-like FMN-containing flavoprotein (pyridoxamine 5'-phosphate oxidase superfamily)